MYIGFFSYYSLYNKNRMLEDPSSPIGDNLMYPFVLLAQKLKAMGHRVGTIDLDKLENFDAIVFVEFPGYKNKYFKELIKKGFKNLYLVITESPLIKLDNLDIKNHSYFKKIFTWSDELVDNKRYFKLNYSHKIPLKLNFNIDNKKKLCTLIAGNKLIKHPLALYQERIKAIRWFENNHPEDFDLYGKGWDKYNFEGKFWGFNLARLNRLTFLTKLLKSRYPSYKGSIKSKKETYEQYKFSICYENVRDFNGYITEKIFDCFFGGCVPIYWGAPNITTYLPQNTFINKKDFKSYDDLYLFIKNMTDKEYIGYLENIKKFLKSDAVYPFSAEYFSRTVIKEIIP